MSLAVGTAFVAYLLTGGCAVYLHRRASNRRIRLLSFTVAVLALCRTLSILHDNGTSVASAFGNSLELLEVTASALSLTVIHFLNRENRDRRMTDMRLRLAESAELVLSGADQIGKPPGTAETGRNGRAMGSVNDPSGRPAVNQPSARPPR